MPVRNGARFIREALASLCAQSYGDWQLVVSDNASTDGTVDICQQFVRHDGRISVVVQEHDLGAAENFLFLISRAHGEFFTWAAADDLWAPAYLKTCISALDAHPDIGMAFTGMENIDSSGKPIRQYRRLAGLAGRPTRRTVARYLYQPEILGKANLIHSVLRLDLCRRVSEAVGFPECWGPDMALVLGFLAQGGIHIDHRVLFRKRIPEGTMANPESIELNSLVPGSGIFPLNAYPAYRAGLVSAVKGTGFETMTKVIMDFRYYRARLSELLKRRAHDQHRTSDIETDDSN